MANLAEILKHICKHPRGIRNSFQPVIDVFYIYIINCIDAPSTKIEKTRILMACSYYDKMKIMTKDMGEIKQIAKCEYLTLELIEIPKL